MYAFCCSCLWCAVVRGKGWASIPPVHAGWDLEQNKVIRHYHGHLSGVYSCALHPTIDVLITGGRDSTARVWDIRTKAQIKVG